MRGPGCARVCWSSAALRRRQRRGSEPCRWRPGKRRVRRPLRAGRGGSRRASGWPLDRRPPRRARARPGGTRPAQPLRPQGEPERLLVWEGFGRRGCDAGRVLSGPRGTHRRPWLPSWAAPERPLLGCFGRRRRPESWVPRGCCPWAHNLRTADPRRAAPVVAGAAAAAEPALLLPRSSGRTARSMSAPSWRPRRPLPLWLLASGPGRRPPCQAKARGARGWQGAGRSPRSSRTRRLRSRGPHRAAQLGLRGRRARRRARRPRRRTPAAHGTPPNPRIRGYPGPRCRRSPLPPEARSSAPGRA
mmetsp:Transcript_47460/g.141720  ORF Transcript_47460/g.141720 Transcript_47460/m.141720 type:complete len:303 (+) Transcript_47460:801-1709(+)